MSYIRILDNAMAARASRTTKTVPRVVNVAVKTAVSWVSVSLRVVAANHLVSPLDVPMVISVFLSAAALMMVLAAMVLRS